MAIGTSFLGLLSAEAAREFIARSGPWIRHLFLLAKGVCRPLVLIAAAVGLAAGCLGQDRASAQRFAKAAQKAEKAGDKFHAYMLLTKAAALDPDNAKILAQKDAVSALLAAGSQSVDDPDPAVDADIDLNLAGDSPEEPVGETLSPGEISTEPDLAPPPHLLAPPGKKSFNIRATGQNVFEQVAAQFGIQLLFESGYQDTPVFTFRTEMSMVEAFRALEQLTNSIVIPLSPHMAFVVRDSAQRRADSAPVMFTTIPIPERLTVQDAQEIVTAVQQTLQMKSIAVDPGRHLVYLRDAVSKVIAARQIFSDLSRLRAQVEVDVELLTVTKTSSLGLGLSLPTSSLLVNFGNFLHNSWTQAVGSFTQFATFGGGKTLFGLGVTEAEAFATLANNSASSVFTSNVIALDGQPATLTVGDRYPIITNQYVGDTSGQGQIYAPPPTVQFEDLGLVLKITPTVHENGEMTLDVDAGYKVLGSGSADGIPIISQKHYQGKVRLGSDEWAVISGLTEEDDSKSITGIPFLSAIPVIGRLFRKEDTNKENTETLIILKPHILNLPPWDFPTHTLWVGTETKPIGVY